MKTNTKEYKREWYQKNKERIREKSNQNKRNCYARHKDNPEFKTRNLLARNKYLSKYPWVKHYHGAMKRCKYSYGKYYGRIKTELTMENAKYLWFRDRAYLMKRPSIDRINPYGNYTITNCRFLELEKNQHRKRRKRGLNP